jgi:hypothetical protein
LDYADYDLVSADGLSDFQPPNEEEDPPPPLDASLQQNLEDAIQWIAEEQELEGHEDAASEGEEEKEKTS